MALTPEMQAKLNQANANFASKVSPTDGRIEVTVSGEINCKSADPKVVIKKV